MNNVLKGDDYEDSILSDKIEQNVLIAICEYTGRQYRAWLFAQLER